MEVGEALDQAFVELVKVVIVAAFGLLVPLMVRLLQKAGLEVNASKEARLNQLAMVVAAEVEEWAAAKLKSNLLVTSGDKLERAVASMIAKLPGLTEAEAKDAIRAALPQIGLGAAAGLKELGKGIAQK